MNPNAVVVNVFAFRDDELALIGELSDSGASLSIIVDALGKKCPGRIVRDARSVYRAMERRGWDPDKLVRYRREMNTLCKPTFDKYRERARERNGHC